MIDCATIFITVRRFLYFVFMAIGFAWFSSATCSAQERVVLEGDFTAAKAMKRIYGNFDDGKKASVWKPGITCDHKTFDMYYDADQIKEHMGDDDFEARAASVKRFRANGADKYYMLTSTTWAICHACRPVLGVFLWKKQKEGWLLEKGDRCFGTFGSYGELPETNYIVRMSPDKFGIMLLETYFATGGAFLYYRLITDWENRFKLVLSGLGDESYDMGCTPPGCSWLRHAYSSRIRFSAKRSSVVIDYSGTYIRKTPKGLKRSALKQRVTCDYDSEAGEYVKKNDRSSKCLEQLPFQESIE